MADRVLLLLTADGRYRELPAAETVSPDALAEYLHTDVTEPLGLFQPPLPHLCYYIDARGGEKALPANFCGTAFYHTGCPIYGDLLLAVSENDTVHSLTAQEAETVRAWLHAMFPDFLTNETEKG